MQEWVGKVPAADPEAGAPPVDAEGGFWKRHSKFKCGSPTVKAGPGRNIPEADPGTGAQAAPPVDSAGNPSADPGEGAPWGEPGIMPALDPKGRFVPGVSVLLPQ